MEKSTKVDIDARRMCFMVNLHRFSAFQIGKSQKRKKNCLEVSFFLSQSFVDPILKMGKSILSTTLLPFFHSIVSKILCSERIGFIMLPRNKIPEIHGLLLLSERVLGVNFVLYVMKFE